MIVCCRMQLWEIFGLPSRRCSLYESQKRGAFTGTTHRLTDSRWTYPDPTYSQAESDFVICCSCVQRFYVELLSNCVTDFVTYLSLEKDVGRIRRPYCSVISLLSHHICSSILQAHVAQSCEFKQDDWFFTLVKNAPDLPD